jgi:hypothetical protein
VHGGRRRAKYAGAPTTATLIGPITRTAIMPRRPSLLDRSGIEPLRNDVARRHIGVDLDLESGKADRKRAQMGAMTAAPAR